MDTSFLTKQEASFKKAYETLNIAQNKKIDKDYLKLVNTLKSEKITSLSVNKEFIKSEIKQLILDQYYYQEGVYQNKVSSDKTILEAVQLLKNKPQYAKILAAKQ